MPKIDILTAMKARRQITVDQYRAARRWQALQAQADDIVLARCARALGHDGNTLLCAVLGDEKSLTEAAAARGTVRRCDLEYVSQRFRECLQTLAEEFARQDRPRRRLGSAPMRQTAAGGGNAPAGFLLIPQAIPLADLAASKAHYIGIS